MRGTPVMRRITRRIESVHHPTRNRCSARFTGWLLWFASGMAAAAAVPSVGPTPLDDAALAPLQNKLASAIDDAVDSRRAGGFGIALLVDGQVRWLHAAGLADRSRTLPFTEDTPLAMGELSRLVLAALAMDLAAQGKLALDAPASRWFNSPPIRSRFADTREITVRDLLTHHSGLPYARLRGAYRAADVPLEPLDDSAWYLAQPTGSVQVGSNLGYERLARVIEAAGGESLDTLLATRITAPLRLHTMSWQPLADTARGHRKGKVAAPMLAREHRALGLAASLADYARFAAAMMPGALRAFSPLDANARGEMSRVQNAEVALDVGDGTGLAWNLSNSVRPGVGRIAVLYGAFPEHRTELRLALDHGVGVLAVGNWDEVGEVLFERSADALDGLLKLRADAAPRERERPLPARIVLPPRVEVGALAARYATPAGLVETRVRDDGFEMLFGGLRFRASPRDDDWYRVRYDLLGILPIGFSRLNRVAIAPARLAGEQVMLGYAGDRHVLLGTAFTPDPGLSSWARYAGIYRLRNPDALSELAELSEATLSFTDGVLALGYELSMVITVAPRLPLLAIGDGLFVIAGRGPAQGEEVRIVTSTDPPQIHYSGYVLERTR